MRQQQPWDALVGSSTRAPRSLETREVSRRPVAYVPPSTLPTPAEQDGFTFRWVRIASRNNDDKTNFSKRAREGYTPVRAEDHPEIMPEMGGLAQESGTIEVGGLILCKIPTEQAKAREDYYARQSQLAIESADSQFLQDNDYRMQKVINRQSRFGRADF